MRRPDTSPAALAPTLSDSDVSFRSWSVDHMDSADAEAALLLHPRWERLDGQQSTLLSGTDKASGRDDDDVLYQHLIRRNNQKVPSLVYLPDPQFQT